MLTLDEDTHVYSLDDGRRIVSVTQALELTGLRPRYYGSEWYSLRGRAVHKACELDDLGVLDEASAGDVAGWLAAWRRFRIDTRFRPVHVEERLYSSRYDFAGTCDVVGMLDDAWTVIDRKSIGRDAGRPEPWVAFQTAGYEVLAIENHALPDAGIRRAAVVLDPSGDYFFEEYAKRTDRWRFLAAATICNARRELYGSFDVAA